VIRGQESLAKHVKRDPGTRTCPRTCVSSLPIYSNRGPVFWGGVPCWVLGIEQNISRLGRRVSAARRDQLLNPNAKPLLADGGELRRAGCHRGSWAYQATAISRLNGSNGWPSRCASRQTKDDPKAVLQLLPARAWGSRYLNRGKVRAAWRPADHASSAPSMAVIGTQTTSIVCPPAFDALAPCGLLAQRGKRDEEERWHPGGASGRGSGHANSFLRQSWVSSNLM